MDGPIFVLSAYINHKKTWAFLTDAKLANWALTETLVVQLLQLVVKMSGA